MKSKNTNAVALDKAWADVIARNNVQTPPKGSVTATQFARQTGQTYDAAAAFLRRKCQIGTMASSLVTVMAGGRRRAVRYFLPVKA